MKVVVMCGITAFLGKGAGSKYVIEGIKLLRNRGYDSIGCCSCKQEGGELVVSKFANRVGGGDSFGLLEETFEYLHGSHHNLIAHCRWATTGRVTDSNSHPHVDTVLGRIALVHNGIISNYGVLKDFLIEKGVEFKSETDTEVIVNLIAYYLKIGNGDGIEVGMIDAIKLALKELEGTWALVIMDRLKPNSLWVCKKGSPILVGYDENMAIISSETSGFSNYLKNYHPVGEGQIIRISLEKEGGEGDSKLKFYRDNKMTELSSHLVVHQELMATSPSPFPHWTLKEIMEQKFTVVRAINGGGRILNESRVKLGGLRRHTRRLMKIDHLVIISSGTSFHAGLLGAKYMVAMSGFKTVRVYDASEFSMSDLTPSKSSSVGVIVISQSGETRDVVSCMEMIRERRPEVLIFSVINVVESLIAREADCGVYLNAGREVGVASTKSFTNQVVVLMLIAIWFAQCRKLNHRLRVDMIRGLHNIGEVVEEGLEMMKEPCEKLVDCLVDKFDGINGKKGSMFILGRDKGWAVAREGALKIKEISYLHAEAYPAGGLKHGPLALIEEGTPVILIRTGDGETRNKIDIAGSEVKSRGAMVIGVGVGECDSNIYDWWIPIPKAGHFEPILANIPLQYVAYLLSCKFGNSPDFPKNLAKCVSVD